MLLVFGTEIGQMTVKCAFMFYLFVRQFFTVDFYLYIVVVATHCSTACIYDKISSSKVKGQGHIVPFLQLKHRT